MMAKTDIGLTFQWYKDSTAIPGATQNEFYASVAGGYYVKTSSADGCTGISDTLTVDVHPNPPKSVISRSGDTLYSSVPTHIQWFLNGQLLSGAMQSFYTQSPLDTGNYRVLSGKYVWMPDLVRQFLCSP